MNAPKKYVVSRTLEKPIWRDTTIIRENVIESVWALKAQAGGDILTDGSSQLVHAMVEHDLIDELHLLVYPLILGSGKRLLPDAVHKTFTLRSATTSGRHTKNARIMARIVRHAAGAFMNTAKYKAMPNGRLATVRDNVARAKEAGGGPTAIPSNRIAGTGREGSGQAQTVAAQLRIADMTRAKVAHGAVNPETGERRAFDRTSGIDLVDAVLTTGFDRVVILALRSRPPPPCGRHFQLHRPRASYHSALRKAA